MTTTFRPTTSDRDAAPERGSSGGVRLVWAPRDAGSPLAGAWWPRSRDATTELRALLPTVAERVGGPATRVSLNIDAWDADQPRRLQIGDTLVRLGWFRTLDAATIALGRYGPGRLSVVVIPYDADATAAQAVLDRLATAAQWPQSTGEVLESIVGEGRPAWEK